jgi:glutamate racemase
MCLLCANICRIKDVAYAEPVTSSHWAKIQAMTCIGVFDSGVGGLSVLREIRAHIPSARLLYFADTAHVPYGTRSMSQIKSFSEAITAFLIAQGAQIIVIACNTASAAALKYLREKYAQVPFVGMEPAVKPAAEMTKTNVIGVMATQTTFQGELFASVMSRFADIKNVQVIQQVCPGLVQQIERGELETPQTESLLRGWVEPMLAQRADAIVLGCTHYPFVLNTLKRICGDKVNIIDPAPAVARQVARVVTKLPHDDSESELQAQTYYFVSGNYVAFQKIAKKLLASNQPLTIHKVNWVEGQVNTQTNAVVAGF